MFALTPRRPIDGSRVIHPHGQVYVISDRCKGCKFCIQFCPEDVLEESKDLNVNGYRYPVVASGKEDGCVQCGFCTLVCPELAIYTQEVAAS
jgi:NAD-dependent dihydropyrimidine dehydrogenase PreA subunit